MGNVQRRQGLQFTPVAAVQVGLPNTFLFILICRLRDLAGRHDLQLVVRDLRGTWGRSCGGVDGVTFKFVSKRRVADIQRS